MNTCWKCSRQLPEGQVECEHGCVTRMSDEDAKRFAQCLEQIAKRRRIDWSTVRTAEDLICVVSTIFSDATVAPDSAVAKKLERFLEPKEQP